MKLLKFNFLILVISLVSFTPLGTTIISASTTDDKTCTGTSNNPTLDGKGVERDSSGNLRIKRLECAAGGIQNFLQGPISRSIIILAVILCGGMWFLNRQAQHAQTLGRIAIGGTLIFAAPSLIDVLGIVATI